MTTPAHPGRMFFVTLPVADVARSRAFFTALGFTFDERFSGEGAACMQVGEQASVMLGSHETFAQHSKLPMADPRTHALALYSFDVPAREDVDRVVDTALAAGAVEADPLEDLGFMVSRSFFDLDGHGWQVMWTDPAAAQPDAEPAAQGAGV
ncbi:glyoxalase [Modestobacter sp. L9-4]|uniref:VOC family protein n=1 Tax=Modestobacter sp. L9-4 TaxID=2851567 RepID=UPI001C7425E7|nr:VOC family protein [Modestobacter sp. L9-4]QXG75560.1 glyoxalase [Modestobacter sp. L9-4]